jgi:hypothetical protein
MFIQTDNEYINLDHVKYITEKEKGKKYIVLFHLAGVAVPIVKTFKDNEDANDFLVYLLRNQVDKLQEF